VSAKSKELTWDSLSAFSQKVLRVSIKQYEYAHWNYWPVAGHGMAPYLSAARSLVMKGLMHMGRTGQYYPSDAGIKFFNDAGRPEATPTTSEKSP